MDGVASQPIRAWALVLMVNWLTPGKSYRVLETTETYRSHNDWMRSGQLVKGRRMFGSLRHAFYNGLSNFTWTFIANTSEWRLPHTYVQEYNRM